jgi:ABC-type molybdate transport system permease subunit
MRIVKTAETITSSWPLSVAAIVAILIAIPVVYHIAVGAFRRIDRTPLDVAHVYGFSVWKMTRSLARNGLILSAVCGFVRVVTELGTLAVLSNQSYNFPQIPEPFLTALLFFIILTTTVSVVTLMQGSRCCRNCD